MRAFGFISFLALILAITSCSKPGPEEVLRQFQVAIASGDCEQAKKLTCESATDAVQSQVDAGCIKYSIDIINISCTITGDLARCYCTQRYEPNYENGDWTYPGFRSHDWTSIYGMKKVDEEWKVSGRVEGGDFINFEEIGGLDMASYDLEMHEQTPRAVVALYEQHLSVGDCKKALQLTVGNARQHTLAISDAGCEPFKRTVTSIECTDMKGYISCKCEFKEDGYYDYWTYILKSSGNGWKITLVDSDWNK